MKLKWSSNLEQDLRLLNIQTRPVVHVRKLCFQWIFGRSSLSWYPPVFEMLRVGRSVTGSIVRFLIELTF